MDSVFTRKPQQNQGHFSDSPETHDQQASGNVRVEQRIKIYTDAQLNVLPAIPDVQTFMETGPFGESVQIIETPMRIDALGRVIPAHDIAGISWSGLKVPHDAARVCANPYGLHGPRLVFESADGAPVESAQGRIILCRQCLELHEDDLKTQNTWGLFGLLYKAKEL